MLLLSLTLEHLRVKDLFSTKFKDEIKVKENDNMHIDTVN